MRISSSRLILAVIVTLFSASVTYSAQSSCNVRLTTIPNSPWVSANGAMVTGPTLYPLKVVLGDLELTVRDLDRLAGKRVLSVGEGFSDLLPALLNHGVKAQAVDSWYKAENFPDTEEGQLMKAYAEKYKQNLLVGDARHLSLRSQSYDLVVSHKMIDSFVDFEDRWSAMKEMIRLTRVGGQAKVYAIEFGDLPRIIHRVKAAYGENVGVAYSTVSATWSLPQVVNTLNHKGALLTFTVRGTAAKPFQPPAPIRDGTGVSY